MPLQLKLAYKRKLQQKRTETLRAKSWTGHTLNQLIKLDLEIGYGLIPLIDQDTGGTLLSRVRGIRKKLSLVK